MKNARGFVREMGRATKSKKLISALLMFALVLLPVTGVADSNDTKIAEAYEKVMDKALEEALLLELDTTASQLKGHKGKAVASAMVSLLKAANEIESDNGTAEDETGKSGEDTEKKTDGETASDSSEKSKITDSMYKRAAKYGAYIRDVDTQLVFCSLLKKEGYDLGRVYPNGVEVDTDLRSYQIFDVEKMSGTIDTSKVLIFSREDSNEPELIWKETSNESEDSMAYYAKVKERREAGYPYTVKLRPDLMFSDILADRCAASYEECTAIIILDKGYVVDTLPSFKVTHTRMLDGTVISQTVEYKYCFGYEAYEGLIFFNKANPDVYYLVDFEYHPSPVSDRVCVSNGEELYVTIPYTDSDGNDATYVGTLDDHAHWNIAKYMIGKHDDTVIAEYTKEDNGISLLHVYFYLAGQTISVE